MFAVIKTGGKQYRVAADDVIAVAKLDAAPGTPVTFDQVLMFTNDGGTQLGGPTVAGVAVAGEVVEQKRGPKVIAFKKRRRQNSKRKRGHRQDFTVVRITEILTGGAKPARRTAASEAAAEPKVEAAAEPTPQIETSAAEAPAPADAAATKKPRAPRRKKAEGSGPAAE
jgi:large subunit ribosomal protein L21